MHALAGRRMPLLGGSIVLCVSCSYSQTCEASQWSIHAAVAFASRDLQVNSHFCAAFGSVVVPQHSRLQGVQTGYEAASGCD